MPSWRVALLPFLLLLFISLALALPVEPSYLVDDNFDGDGAWRNPSNWTVKDMPGYDISVDPLVSYEEGGKSVRLRSMAPGYSYGNEMWRLFRPTVTGTVEFRVKLASADENALSVELRSTTGGPLLQLLFGNGYVRYLADKWERGPALVADRWYQVKVVFDCCYQQYYDLYVDGAQVAKGVKRENSGIINALVVGVDTNHVSTSWFDSLRIYTDWPEVNPELEPIILNAPVQYPEIVDSNDEVFIKVYASGRRAPIEDLKLVWRKDPHWGVDGNRTLEMVMERGGIYSSKAPIPANPAGETIYYVVRAVDGRGNAKELGPYSYDTRYSPPFWSVKALLLGLVIGPPFLTYRKKAGGA